MRPSQWRYSLFLSGSMIILGLMPSRSYSGPSFRTLLRSFQFELHQGRERLLCVWRFRVQLLSHDPCLGSGFRCYMDFSEDSSLGIPWVAGTHLDRSSSWVWSPRIEIGHLKQSVAMAEMPIHMVSCQSISKFPSESFRKALAPNDS
jgi:hypothetical protein